MCWLLLLSLPCAAADQAFQTSAPQAILIDADTLTVLYEKNADQPAKPASTSKIMTAELVFEAIKEGRLKLDDTVEISENAWRNGGAPAHGSTMFAALHSSVRVEDLIRGLVIVSGNDAAIALAERLAGSEGAFATRMTERAHELGFTHLTFTDSWGKDDPDQRVTAHDMAFLAAHLIRTYPDLYRYFGEKDFTWNKIKQPNRNPLLAMDIGCDGLKTGNIDDSGYGIVASAVQNGQRLILALYGAKSAKERTDEAVRIFQWGFRTFAIKTLFSGGEVIGYARVYGGTQGSVPLVSTTPVKLMVPRDPTEKLTGRIDYVGPLVAPVTAGKQVAHLQIFRGENQVLDVPLQTAADVKVGSLSRRAMDASLEYAEELFRKYVLKK
ncbi:MAG TPA: D-alanyl-D-alanine carboxypeptidase family protein [Methylovirgula sp.]|nr:D-alanyl-D-alanine carboxypeptidase family protein [Methylovirgula sp.]